MQRHDVLLGTWFRGVGGTGTWNLRRNCNGRVTALNRRNRNLEPLKTGGTGTRNFGQNTSFSKKSPGAGGGAFTEHPESGTYSTLNGTRTGRGGAEPEPGT